MAGLITVRLQRNDAQPWGFRLQGGKDFGTPLLIQKVNGGSLAEKAGLQVADAVVKVNGQDVYSLSHKNAQDSIVKAGNSIEIVVSRTPGGTWKPNVTPLGNIPAPSPVGGAPAPVTKTSLAYKGPPPTTIHGHNTAAKPFSPQLNGLGVDQVKSITSKQYNNPVGLYSDQAIAETLSAQAEVLAGGALGVNFMKNEKTKFDASHSEVLKLVQEIDAEPRTPEPVESVSPGGGVVLPPPVSVTGIKHVAAPENKPPSTTSPQTSLQPGQNVCGDCERLIVGGPIPSGVISAPLAPAGPTSPQPGTLAPLPFHAPRLKPSHVNPPRSFKPPPSNVAAPKPFGAPAAPFSSPAPPSQFSAPPPSVTSLPSKPFTSVPFTPPPAPAPAPISAPAHAPFISAPAPPSSFPKTLPGQSESSLSTSQSYAEKMNGQRGEIEDISCCQDKSKRMSVCSSEVCSLSEKRSAVKAMGPLAEDPVRASPVPFSKGEVNESFGATGQETIRKSENIETSDEGNVHITRKTKVEESFVRSQKMYTAEISSSQLAHQVRAASPELEQIMTRKQIYQSYDTARLTPQLKHPQSERCLTPEIENLMEKPHGTWSPMPPACMVRPISPHAIISYPPDIPTAHTTIHQPRVATPEQFQEARETVERFVDHSKHVRQSQTAASGRTTQSYLQQSFSQQQQQQYTPRYDMSESFSAYNGRGNPSNPGGQFSNTGNPGNHHGNGNTGNPGNHHGNGNPGNHHGNGNTGNPGNHHENGNPGNHHGNGNPGNHHGNGNPGNHNGNGNQGGDENPTVTEPDDSEEKYSRKSSGQSQKSRKSASEEESSRRVFTDFGGPQVMTSLNVESTTEGGVEKTSVTKSEKMEYASCEFESSRKSSILQDSRSAEEGKSTSSEPKKKSYPTFSATEASIDEEETVTKSQVEQIIKQELNKVFQMAQAMEKTNLNEMYDQQSQHSSQTAAQVSAVKTTDQSSQKSSSLYSQKKSYTGEAITQTGKLTSGLTVAPERHFTPQPLESSYPLTYQNIPTDSPRARYPPGEPKSESKPGYIPVTGSRDSPLIQALTIAPDRSYSPLPTATVVETPPFITPPKPQASSMVDALMTAPSTPFSFGESHLSFEESSTVKRTTKSKQESVQKYAPKPPHGDFKPISAGESETCSKYASLGQSVERSTVKSYQPVTDELKSSFKSSSKVQSQTAESETQQSIKSHQSSLSATRTERPITPSGLHPPGLLPYYQRNIGEIPLAHRSNSPVPHQIKAPELKPPRPESVPHPTTERRGSVKAMSEAYSQQVDALNNKFQPTPTDFSSSVSYVSAGAYSSGSVTKTYSYEQEHKSIDTMGYHASPLAGKKTSLAGERTIPKCSSPVLGKLDHTKQVFKPSIPVQQSSSLQSSVAEQANLKQAPPFFTQEKGKSQTPWVVVKEDKENYNAASFKLPPPPKPTLKPSLPIFPSVNKASAFPEPPKPAPGLKPSSMLPDAGPGGAKGASTAGTTAPRRGRGVLNAAVGAGARIPLCGSCNNQIRGPFITALGKIWCPDHFVCVNAQCRRPLQDIGFVEEAQGLYCEYCFEQYLAPSCNKCNAKIKGDCLNAIGKHFHPECFKCAYCGKQFGNTPFFLEDALPYCEADWNELFTTKCFSCGFPIEAGDRWVEALSNNYHSQCFSCTMCKKNLEGQSFFAKGGRPFCKNHAR